jgi:hypothetical protein
MRRENVEEKLEHAHCWTVEKLRRLGTAGHLELFKTLSAPSVLEMQGEFRGHYFGADGHSVCNALWQITSNRNWTSGRWLGKSFLADSDADGHGFNNLSRFGVRVRRWPMKTGIGASRYDNGEVFALNYRHYLSAASIVSMQDEIRKVGEGLYLGVGHWQLPTGKRLASVWFALSGPVA